MRQEQNSERQTKVTTNPFVTESYHSSQIGTKSQLSHIFASSKRWSSESRVMLASSLPSRERGRPKGQLANYSKMQSDEKVKFENDGLDGCSDDEPDSSG
jgi:hypothetical protein